MRLAAFRESEEPRFPAPCKRRNATDFERWLRHSLSPTLSLTEIHLAPRTGLSRRQGQQLDPPYHGGEEAPGQMALCEHQPVISGVECRLPDYADSSDPRLLGGGPRGIQVGIILPG